VYFGSGKTPTIQSICGNELRQKIFLPLFYLCSSLKPINKFGKIKARALQSLSKQLIK